MPEREPTTRMSGRWHEPDRGERTAEPATAWPRWREIDDRDVLVERICGLYDAFGDTSYEEVVTQTHHALQTAQLAVDDGSDAPLVAAALLHDVGHLLLDGLERETGAERDHRHEQVAARFLANWFDRAVTDPVRHHVDAKRYLCAVDPTYHEVLSPASVRSLELQGGPMDAVEAERFAELAGAADACRLRRWDDRAKDPDRRVGTMRDHAALLRELVVLSR